MIFELNKNTIILSNISKELKPRNIIQLMAWGFKQYKEENCFKLSVKVETVFPQIINYLQKQNIKYTLTKECSDLVSQFNEKQSSQTKLIDIGRKIKDGEFNKQEMHLFNAFILKNISRKLKDHQVKASFHLINIQNGANFSVPGSGKTTVVLTVFEKLRLEKKVSTLFVVGPPSCFWTWKDEYKNVLGRKPNTKILAGEVKTQRDLEYFKSKDFYDLYLITYQTALNDQDNICHFLNKKKIGVYLVIDEAHYMKQINGNWSNAILRFAQYSAFRCVLTGTPMPKSYSDLFNLFDFLWPQINLLSSIEKIKINNYEKSNDNLGANKILKNKLGPLFYRVRKSDLGLKPQIFKKPEMVDMNIYERTIYESILNKIKYIAGDEYLKNIEIAKRLQKGRIIRLRQCVSYAKLVNNAVTDYSEDLTHDDSNLKYIISNYDKLEIPAKMVKILELINKFQKANEKVVVWANFIGTIKLLEKTFKKKGFYCKKIIGEIPFETENISEEETREKIRNEFIDIKSGLDILIANPAACAESISLHKTCHNAVYYDLSYNCAQYLQSLDRIHRVGGSENQSAFYYYLQYKNTIDRDIKNNLDLKAIKMNELIEADYNIYSLNMFDDEDNDSEAYKRLFEK